MIGEINARKDIHKRGLAAAVFAQERKDLPLVNIEADIAVRVNFTEGLGDVRHFYCNFVTHFFLFLFLSECEICPLSRCRRQLFSVPPARLLL